MSKTFDLGPVSAYALAVKHGYEGTEEQWVAEMESKRKEAVASAESASESATEAVNSAAASANSASTASTKADEAGNSATRAESYAVGGTGIRQNEDVDNAKYYYQQAKQISGGLSGALAPMGTVLFDDLQNQTKQAGYMYNVVDAFTTDDTFKEGAGYTYPEGTNVYYTVDGYWDCLAGTITPAGIGALEVDGDSKDNIISFTSNDEAEPASWSEVETLTSKEKHSSILSKISTMFKNVRYLYKMLGTTDISAIGDGTATGAISALNNNLTNKANTNHSHNVSHSEVTLETNDYIDTDNSSLELYILDDAKFGVLVGDITLTKTIICWQEIGIAWLSKTPYNIKACFTSQCGHSYIIHSKDNRIKLMAGYEESSGNQVNMGSDVCKFSIPFFYE